MSNPKLSSLLFFKAHRKIYHKVWYYYVIPFSWCCIHSGCVLAETLYLNAITRLQLSKFMKMKHRYIIHLHGHIELLHPTSVPSGCSCHWCSPNLATELPIRLSMDALQLQASQWMSAGNIWQKNGQQMPQWSVTFLGGIIGMIFCHMCFATTVQDGSSSLNAHWSDDEFE